MNVTQFSVCPKDFKCSIESEVVSVVKAGHDAVPSYLNIYPSSLAQFNYQRSQSTLEIRSIIAGA